MPRVLVVDDDQRLRTVVAHFLKKAGYDVAEARSGDEALKAMISALPDAVLLDVMMPGMNGFEVCKTAKSTPSLAACPIVLFTARSGREDVVQAIQSGADDYLVKPFTNDALLVKIQKALEKRVQGATRVIHRGKDQRRSDRRPVPWTVSWASASLADQPLAYKNAVANISLWGFAFFYKRCSTCTGYEVGTVHSRCLLAPHSNKIAQGKIVDFVLSVSREAVVEARGRIAHIYQPPESGDEEIVGVAFQELSPRAEELLRRHLA